MKLAAILLVLTGLNAVAGNIVLDGNFVLDTGAAVDNGPLSDGSPWTVTRSDDSDYGTQVVSLPSDLGPIDPLTVGSPDVAGSNTVYFVADFGTNTLSQTLSGLVAGDTYEVSFDAYLAFTGIPNPAIPNFSATLGGTTIASFPLSSLPVPNDPTDDTAWTHFYNTFTADQSGSLELDFIFNAPNDAGGGKDILLNRVYVGDPVSSSTPEPASLCLAGLALAGGMLLARRRRAA